jgi:hypothetical protein
VIIEVVEPPPAITCQLLEVIKASYTTNIPNHFLCFPALDTSVANKPRLVALEHQSVWKEHLFETLASQWLPVLRISQDNGVQK